MDGIKGHINNVFRDELEQWCHRGMTTCRKNRVFWKRHINGL